MSPEPILVILDLDETLVYSTATTLERDHDFVVGPYMIYKRPGVDSFLRELAPHFSLAVWSSSTSDYAQALADNLFINTRLEFLWARERCTQRLDSETHEYYWLKDLKKVRRKGFPLSRVLVIDDSPEKLARHYGNRVPVRPFFGDPTDDELPWLATYLLRIASCANVRHVEKRGWRSRIARS
jgi:RNA polymerase II subunit A small phosphatase-like protein